MDDKIINLKNMSYEEIKKVIESFVKRAREEGIALQSNLLYNEKTGAVDITFIRKI